MTLESMRWHEGVTLRFAEGDYRRQGLVRLVRPYVRGARVLDMRCLRGELAVALAMAGCEVTALDAYAEAVKLTNTLAKRKGISSPIAQQWDLEGLVRQVGKQRFDTVVCLDVLNHVRDDEETITEIAAVLPDEGRLLLVVPAFPWLLGKRDQTLGHLRRYTRRGLHALLERHGFTLQLMRYWNFTALPMYVLIERVLRMRTSDEFRYARSGGPLEVSLNRALGWWYQTVERHLHVPFGLSLFVIAHKVQQRSSPRAT